jgi:endoglucanase
MPGHSLVTRSYWDRLPLATLLVVVSLTACPRIAWSQTPTGFALLGRGVNYGNMLEAPAEGDWGVRFDDAYPQMIHAAGFDSVRIPIRWSSRTAQAAPYSIDASFLARVKSIVDLHLAQGLKVVLNVHHFEEFYADPDGQQERFLAIWRQLAKYFQDADERVFFELLNEPHGKLDADRWNPLLAAAIGEIRATNPTRWIVVGPDQFNSIKRLPQLALPAADRRLVVTVHYYLPFAFTHQGASWVRPSPPVGKEWTGSAEEHAEIQRDFAHAVEWAKKNDRPIYVGEFGAYDRADMDSRTKWTAAVRTTCEEADLAWAYWELAAGFGILDPKTRQWRPQLVRALIER